MSHFYFIENKWHNTSLIEDRSNKWSDLQVPVILGMTTRVWKLRLIGFSLIWFEKLSDSWSGLHSSLHYSSKVNSIIKWNVLVAN